MSLGRLAMSDDEGAFVWGGGEGTGDGDDDFSNPALGGDDGDGDEDGSFVWGGGGGGDTSSDEEHSDSGSDRGGAAEPQSSLDLLGSLLAGADMTDAIRQPEPEPELKAAPKKKNKRAGEVRPPSVHRSPPSVRPPQRLTCSDGRAEKRPCRDDEGLESRTEREGSRKPPVGHGLRKRSG
eukprot:COSAG02_NODE_1219_length_13812_cov_108.713629_5_plen_180_part_00